MLASQSSVRKMPFDFLVSWEAYAQQRESWFRDPELKLAALLAANNVVIDADAQTQLVNAIVPALEKADEKIDNHLMESTSVR